MCKKKSEFRAERQPQQRCHRRYHPVATEIEPIRLAHALGELVAHLQELRQQRQIHRSPHCTVGAQQPVGQLDARLWDLDRKTGRQRLITRGVYRLKDNQNGRFTFTLDGNGWKFAKGHRIVVELLGRDAPTYGPSPTAFSATLTGVKVALPIR